MNSWNLSAADHWSGLYCYVNDSSQKSVAEYWSFTWLSPAEHISRAVLLEKWKRRNASCTSLLCLYLSLFRFKFTMRIFLNMCFAVFLYHVLPVCGHKITRIVFQNCCLSSLSSSSSVSLLSQIITLKLSLISSSLVGILPRVPLYVAAFDTCSK